MSVIVRDMIPVSSGLVSSSAPSKGTGGWFTILYVLVAVGHPETVWVHFRAKVRDLQMFLCQMWGSQPYCMGFLVGDEAPVREEDFLADSATLWWEVYARPGRPALHVQTTVPSPSSPTFHLRMRFLHAQDGLTTDFVVVCDKKASTLQTLQDMVSIHGQGGSSDGVCAFHVMHVNSFTMLTDIQRPLWDMVGPLATLLFIGGEAMVSDAGPRASFVVCFFVLLHDSCSGPKVGEGTQARVSRLETLLYPGVFVHELIDVVAEKGYVCPGACVRLLYAGEELPPWKRCRDCPKLMADLQAFIDGVSSGSDGGDKFGPLVAIRT